MHNDFHNKGLNHRFRHILSFINVGIPLQCILKDGQFFFVVGYGFGLYLLRKHFDFFLKLLHLGFQFGALRSE